jgi:hypothetical protein
MERVATMESLQEIVAKMTEQNETTDKRSTDWCLIILGSEIQRTEFQLRTG